MNDLNTRLIKLMVSTLFHVVYSKVSYSSILYSSARREAQRNYYCSTEETLTTDDKSKITVCAIISTENLSQHHLFNGSSYTVVWSFPTNIY